MPKYILKRIVGTIPTLIIVVTFVFFFVRLIPGDPARLVAGEQATQDDVEAVREELGLNKSIPTQYVTYVTGLLKGSARSPRKCPPASCRCTPTSSSWATKRP